MPEQPTLDPDTLEAAARSTYPHLFDGRLKNSLLLLPIFTLDQARENVEKKRAAKIEEIKRHATAYLAALPEVTSDVYIVAIKNTEKSTGRVFYDYPGCTPEIGTLDDARELLNWVNEGTPSSPDSPYSSEARIYKLTEVNDA